MNLCTILIFAIACLISVEAKFCRFVNWKKDLTRLQLLNDLVVSKKSSPMVKTFLDNFHTDMSKIQVYNESDPDVEPLQTSKTMFELAKNYFSSERATLEFQSSAFHRYTPTDLSSSIDESTLEVTPFVPSAQTPSSLMGSLEYQNIVGTLNYKVSVQTAYFNSNWLCLHQLKFWKACIPKIADLEVFASMDKLETHAYVNTKVYESVDKPVKAITTNTTEPRVWKWWRNFKNSISNFFIKKTTEQKARAMIQLHSVEMEHVDTQITNLDAYVQNWTPSNKTHASIPMHQQETIRKIAIGQLNSAHSSLRKDLQLLYKQVARKSLSKAIRYFNFQLDQECTNEMNPFVSRKRRV